MITYDGTYIKIRDGTYTFKDVYEALRNRNVIKKLDNFYMIDASIKLGDGKHDTTLITKNESIVILGEEFQIYRNANFISGTINRTTFATSDGSYISMPNIKLAYGFGCSKIDNNRTQSGNLYLYGSTIKAWGFWGFFGGPDQVVELVGNNILGFGRIEGKKSILYKNRFEKSHGRYGIITLRGKISIFEDNDTLNSELYENYNTRAALYFNPKYSPGLVIRGGVFNGYDQLVFCEPDVLETETSGTMKLINCVILNGYDCYFRDDKTTVEVGYEFLIKVINEDGYLVPNATVTFYYNDIIVLSKVTDDNGTCKVYIPYKRITSKGIDTYDTYTVKVEYGEYTSLYYIEPKRYTQLILKLCDELHPGSCDISAIDDKLDVIIGKLDKLTDEKNTREWNVMI